MEPYVLFENDKFIVFYKPPYYIMDTTFKYLKKTPNEIAQQFKSKRRPFLIYVRDYILQHYGINLRPPNYGVCQRLDIDTSGAVLVAKYNEDFNFCRNIINNKVETTKIYICLVNGIVEKKNGFIKDNIKCDKKGMTYCKTGSEGDPSCSYYQVINDYHCDANHSYSLVFVRIFTGRTHQIRVHMKSIGHPIVSDDRYISKSLRQDNLRLCQRMFLHNIFLSFYYNNKLNKVIVPLSDDLKDCLKKLSKCINEPLGNIKE